MARFKKRPKVVEAIQFTGDNHEAVGHFAGLSAQLTGRDQRLQIKTAGGRWFGTVKPGDWVIRGENGEFIPVDRDTFASEYEAIEDNS